MRSKRAIRKTISAALAVLLSLTSIVPAYAEETPSVDPVGEVVESVQEETEASIQEDVEVVEEDMEETAPEKNTYDGYLILLPARDNASYSFDEDHYLAELSSDNDYVLMYNEGETVDISVKTEDMFSVKYADSREVMISDVSDGAVSFAMPAADLFFSFSEEEDEALLASFAAEEIKEDQADVENVAGEAKVPAEESELQKEAEESQIVEENAPEEVVEDVIADDETADEVVEENAISENMAEEEAGDQVEEAVQEEEDLEIVSPTEISQEDYEKLSDEELGRENFVIVEKNALPEAGSTEVLSTQYVYYKDASFDYVNYVPETDSIAEATVSYESGEIDWNVFATQHIIYKAVLNSDPEYFWYIDVPMYIIESPEGATAKSENYDTEIHLNDEQPEEFSGVIPSENHSHIEGKTIETVKGENFSLTDVNFGYDMNLFWVGIEDDGDFDPDTAGEYNVVYKVGSYENTDVNWYIDCKVIVKDRVENSQYMTVHVVSGELVAEVTLADGTVGVAEYGSDFSTDSQIYSIVAKSAWEGYDEVDPSITAMKDGEEVDAFESFEKDNVSATAIVKQDLEEGSYVFTVDYPGFDIAMRGQKSADRRHEGFKVYDGSSLMASDSATALNDADSEEKSWYGKGNIVSYLTGEDNWCYSFPWDGPAFASFRQVDVVFTDSFMTELENWITELGCTVESIPDYITIACAEGDGMHMAWKGSSSMSYIDITATAHKDDEGNFYLITLSAWASGESTSGGDYQNFVGYSSFPLSKNLGQLKIRKRSYGHFTSWGVEGYNLNTYFNIYKDSSCSDLFATVPVKGGAGISDSTSSDYIDLPAGTYYIREMADPGGHLRDDSVTEVTIGPSEQVTTDIYNNEYVYYGGLIYKYNETTKKPVAGAVFKVNAVGNTTGQDYGTWYFKSDSEGYVRYNPKDLLTEWNGNQSSELIGWWGITSSDPIYGLPADTTITIQEVEAPAGYELNTDTFTIDLSAGNANSYGRIAADMVRIPEKEETPDGGTVQLIKSGSETKVSLPSSQYSLAGAVYGVYDSNNVEVGRLTTDENGASNVLTLDAGDYTVKEITAPKGYKIDVSSYNVKVESEKLSTVNVKDEEEKGTLNILKALEDGDTTNADFTKVSFDLIYQEDTSVKLTGLHPDKDGKLTVTDLYLGEWKLVETASVDDKHEIPSPITVMINSTTPVDYKVINHPVDEDDGSVKLIKSGSETSVSLPNTYYSLEGAVYGVYDSSNAEVGRLTTDKNGVSNTVYLEAGDYTVKEISAPKGFKVDIDSYKVTVTSGKESTVHVTDEEVKGTLNILKALEDGDTTKADFTKVSFDLIYQADTSVKKTGLHPDKDGKLTVTDLYLGEWKLVETASVDDKHQIADPITVKIDSTTPVDYKVINHPIDEKDGSVKLVKTDSETGSSVPSSKYSLAGAVYGIYDSANNEVGRLTTDEKGVSNTVTLKAGNYTVKEITAPKGYKVDVTAHDVKVEAGNVSTVNVSDDEVKGTLNIIKKLEDGDTTKADFTKVTFDLIYQEDTSIKKTGLHPDKDGKLTVTDLLLGKWQLVETASVDEFHVIADPIVLEINSTTPVDYEVVNRMAKFHLEIIKKDAETGNTIPIAGTKFQIIDSNGNPIKAIQDGASEATTEFATDKSGSLSFSSGIPAGKYTLVETQAPFGYEVSIKPQSFEVKTGVDTEPIAIDVSDQPAKYYGVKILKVDKTTGKAAGAGFVFDVTVAEDIKDPSGKVYDGFAAETLMDTLTTGKDGVAESTIKYRPGKYYITEKSAPEGYEVLKDKIEFEIVPEADGNQYKATIKSQNLKDGAIVVEDDVVMKPIKVVKTDADSKNPMPGIQFQIIAKSVKDLNGNVRAGFEEGTVVDTITTGEDGTAVSKDLFFGSYVVKEVGKAKNYIENTDEYDVVVSSKASAEVSVTNTPLKKQMSLTKIDKETGNHCGAGFVFNIVASEDVKDASGKVYAGYTAGSVVDTITTDENGIAASKPLYIGKYYVQEVSAPEGSGYAINTKKYNVTLSDSNSQPMVVDVGSIPNGPTKVKIVKKDAVDGTALAGITFRIKEKGAADSDDQLYVTNKNGMITKAYLAAGKTYVVSEVKTLPGYILTEETAEFTVDEKGLIEGKAEHTITFTNQKNELQVSKQDVTNQKELPGAKLVITDSKGEVVDEWVSTDEPHVIHKIPDGKYRLTETTAPNGYEVEESIEFEIKDSKVAQHVVMYDSPYRDVEISKVDVTTEKELPGCTLTLLDAENNVIESWVSTDEPHKVKLPSGVYTLREDKPADGYVTSEVVTFEVIKTSADDYEVQRVTMTDDVTKVSVSKKDITNSEELPGAHLIIKDSEGKVVDEWDSTNEPHLITKLKTGEYTLTEITAPNNYEVAETITFKVTDTNEIQHVTMFDSPYRDVEISKFDITDKKELPGANLEVRDSEGKVIDSWVSTEESHKIKLPSGRYTLVETKPADGYVTAETISFEVVKRDKEGDVEIQHVDMFDDVTTLEISKQDITTQKELPGARLKITDSEGKIVDEWTSTNTPHVIKKIKIGKYALTEITAPNGYEVAEKIEFEIRDTNEVQKVTMYDAATPTTPKKPRTGDDFNMQNPWMAAGLVVLLLAAGIFMVIRGRKRQLLK